ncbi:hypothetical protein JTB14_023167 [Gonioctena quinquepunctata]|nr:hypothetical protein JTB14_023167 [Gonioctena quinquepunctata]
MIITFKTLKISEWWCTSENFLFNRFIMEGQEDYYSYGSRLHSNHKNSNGSFSDLGEMGFMMLDYLKDAMKAMDMMRGHQMLTDVVLEVGKEIFHAHKVVLAAASPYFKAMFTGGLKECDMNRVKLQGVSPTALARLIHFMYTGMIRVTENTVCQLLPAATMLQVCTMIIL